MMCFKGDKRMSLNPLSNQGHSIMIFMPKLIRRTNPVLIPLVIRVIQSLIILMLLNSYIKSSSLNPLSNQGHSIRCLEYISWEGGSLNPLSNQGHSITDYFMGAFFLDEDEQS